MFSVEQSRSVLDSVLKEALSGGELYAVGGRVRDEVLASLGRPQTAMPDLDYLVTGLALPEILTALQRIGSAELVGASFGVVKFSYGGLTVDIALPRRERSLGPHHREFAVESAPDIPITEDLSRRDFRINMMAKHLRTGEILDPYGGREDLVHSRLDALRKEAFEEDPLRILRGAHFTARFELVPTEVTLLGMRESSELILTVAPERIADELTKLLTRSSRPSIGFELLREVSALHQLLPELMEGWQIEQNEFHRHTVYYHSLACCDAAPPDLGLRLAALLHDIGKPRTKEGPHFYRHEIVGEEMARATLARLRFPGDLIERVCRLVRHHMYAANDSLSEAAIRRFIHRVGPERVDDLFALRHADVIASGLPARDPGEQERFEDRVRWEIEAESPFGVRDLAIGGEEVIEVMRELGLVANEFAGDARVGAVLKYCLEQVLDDPRKNQRDVLREIVRTYLKTK